MKDVVLCDLLDALVAHGVYSASFGDDGGLRDVTFFQAAPPIPEREPGDEQEVEESINEVDAAARALASRGNRQSRQEP